jgi:hypothetical protein
LLDGMQFWRLDLKQPSFPIGALRNEGYTPGRARLVSCRSLSPDCHLTTLTQEIK